LDEPQYGRAQLETASLELAVDATAPDQLWGSGNSDFKTKAATRL